MATLVNTNIDNQCINEIRILSAEMPLKAKSGHQGAPIGCAPIAHVLWSYIMNYFNEDTNWINRDRFVLSNGHASALLYTMLYLTEQGLSINDLKEFRQLHSLTPGHPECTITKGVEVTTGPLGQGASNAVGMAIASHNLADKYNTQELKIFDNYIYCLCGDGCMQEGVFCEAASLAGHLGLGRLILIYDDNKITIDGSTDLSFTEDIEKKFEALGWEVRHVNDGDNDFKAIQKEIEEAKKNIKQPSLIIVKTTCGFGTKFQGSCKSHGLSLNEETIKDAKKYFNLDTNKSFYISNEVKNFYKNVLKKKKNEYNEWKKIFTTYSIKYPERAQEILRRFKKELPENWKDMLPIYTVNDPPAATRNLSGIVLNAMNKILPELIGGSADLSDSNCTSLKEEKDIKKNDYGNKYIRYGVREHGMMAITNGIYSYGGFLPYCATFLNFITYAFGTLRLAALSNNNILCIATHDSIELGEDGPTHQPIEVLSLLRSTPNINIIRPADGNEVSGAYLSHYTNKHTPTVIALCRNKIPHLKNTSAEKVLNGAYILDDFDEEANNHINGFVKERQKVILSGCGSELQLCFEAKEILKNKYNFNVRIVSFPSWSLFNKQTDEYKKHVMMHDKHNIVRFYIEPASTHGFDKYFNVYIGIDQFGHSAPKDVLWNYMSITTDSIVQRVLNFVNEKLKGC